jgi:membrane protein required for colicin V production
MLGICAVSAAFGYWRGFVKETIALATWLVAILLAWQGSWLVEARISSWSTDPDIRRWIARGIIFVVVLAVGGLLAWLMRALVRSTGLTSTDRSLGAIFGLGRGLIILGLLAIGVGLADLDDETWWVGARFRPFCEQIASGILYYADRGNQYLERGDSAVDDIL